MPKEVVIVGMARTPIGDFLGSLKDVSAVDLGTIAANAALERSGVLPEQVDNVVAGMVYKAGAKGNPARQIQLAVGIPIEAPATTVDQQCASSMRAFEIAAHQIMLGLSNISLVVGIESMSRVPYLLLNARQGLRLGNGTIYDSLLYDALVDPFINYHMGVTAENLAEKYSISRKEQDELAFLSQKRAVEAIDKGKFKEEIVPVKIPTKKGTVIVDTDEHPRRDVSLEGLAKLKPAFKENGTVTAGNASGINDGAAAAVLMSGEKARELGIKPLAKVLATASYGVDPEIMGIGPAYAIPKALKQAGLTIDEIDYFEINEAFAAQFLAVNRELNLDMSKVNLNGSGISLGHPVGCTGLRIIVTLVHEMRRKGQRFGVASLCAGGGPSMATVIECLY
ncbi:MAG TPA: thiolase family protein [Thermoanaerobacterales bacterium]|nr:thiolase family protein [Thermoanaerobacterales bacterium]